MIAGPDWSCVGLKRHVGCPKPDALIPVPPLGLGVMSWNITSNAPKRRHLGKFTAARTFHATT